MSTRKKEIMQVLMDAPLNKLSQKSLRWAMSHLPDHDDEGTESYSGNPKIHMLDLQNVDPENDNYMLALGISEPSEEFKEEQNEVLKKAHSKQKYSETAVELAAYLQKNSDNERGRVMMAMILAGYIRGIQKINKEDDPASSLLKKLEALKSILEMGKELGLDLPGTTTTKGSVVLDQDGNIIKGELPEGLSDEMKEKFNEFLKSLKKKDDTE